MSDFEFCPEQCHSDAMIAAGAIVVGDVWLAAQASVWFNAVVRGDTETLRIGERSNIQDLSMVHADPGFPVNIGNDVTIGHRAIIHGATIGDRSMIGMGAILLNGVVVGEECLVGAGSLLTQGKVFPSGSLILGSPARVVRPLTDEERQRIAASAAHYVRRAQAYRGANR
jgi:carbonic anhydrase/acetyltransferase-like protein (isoleucine patch superfamily)